METKNLSHLAKINLLSNIAHNLTVSARSTYIPGTEDIREPGVLRAYNELLHRVTSSLWKHVQGKEDFPLEAIIELMHEFGSATNRQKEIEWVLKQAQAHPLPITH